MKSFSKKTVSVVLSLIILLCTLAPFASAVQAEKEKLYPSIVVPGVFQCDIRLYDDDGNEMLRSDGTPYERPFFLDTTQDIIFDALENALIPVSRLLITQQDKEERAAKAIADVLGRTIGEKSRSDNHGNFVHNVKAIEYNTALSNLSDYDREFALSAIPLNAYVEKAGLDHLYFYSYVSLSSIKKLAEGLYNLIQIAKEETGSDKVNLAPISQGGSIFNALMQLYKDKGLKLSDDVNKVVLIVPAADGTAILGDIYHNGIIDDPEALYGYMIPKLLGEEKPTGYLINLLLRLFPNADLNNILDKATDTLAEDYIEYSTALWALLPSGEYPALREKFLMDEEDEYIRNETDWYYNAQCSHKDNITEAIADGVQFFDLVDYNYDLYCICDSWNKVNADGVIHTHSTSLGAYTVPSSETLPDDYVQANTYCTDPTHNHIDQFRKVDASAGLLPENTFYFCGQGHESTAKNDVIIRLACRILWDESFRDIYTDPAYPQFNFARDSRKMTNLIKEWKDFDTSALDEETKAEFTQALAEAEEANLSTYMPTDEFDAAYDRLKTVTEKISGTDDNAPDAGEIIMNILTKVLKAACEIMLKLFGGKGISDIILSR